MLLIRFFLLSKIFLPIRMSKMERTLWGDRFFWCAGTRGNQEASRKGELAI